MISSLKQLGAAQALSLLLLGQLLAAGDPKGEQNLAAGSPLARGEGIASRFPADRNIQTHPGIIFAEDFETPEFRKNWDEVRDRNGEVLKRVENENQPHLGKQSLRVTATLGKNTGGGMTKWFQSAPSVHIRFYVKFDKDCDYVHHFCTLRANRSLRGGDRWSGFGGAGEKPDGERRFSTALEPWGNWGRWKPPGQWNFYSYWHTMSPSPDGKYWGNGFRPAQQSDIQRDQWICAEFMLKHNTPGKDDGEQAYWIDGNLVGHWKGINWRTDPALLANALTLESYVTDRWTKNQTNTVYFDNLVIAREYIGPSGR